MSTIEPVAYPHPWSFLPGDAGVSSEDAAEKFWAALEEQVLAGSPPALVYLVHPHFPTGHKDPQFAKRLQALLAKAGKQTLFAVDQTYLNFTERTEDDELLDSLAAASDAVALVRSLSKVEGLAALRLGYALASPATAKELASCLPFSGGLYVSEVALAGAVAAVAGPGAAQHRQAVLEFYQAEQEWFSEQLANLGVVVAPSPCPFFCLRGPKEAIAKAYKEGAALQTFVYPPVQGNSEEPAAPPPGETWACCLVADRASNLVTAAKLGAALEEAEKTEQAKSGFPDWMPTELVKPFVGS